MNNHVNNSLANQWRGMLNGLRSPAEIPQVASASTFAGVLPNMPQVNGLTGLSQHLSAQGGGMVPANSAQGLVSPSFMSKHKFTIIISVLLFVSTAGMLWYFVTKRKKDKKNHERKNDPTHDGNDGGGNGGTLNNLQDVMFADQRASGPMSCPVSPMGPIAPPMAQGPQGSPGFQGPQGPFPSPSFTPLQPGFSGPPNPPPGYPNPNFTPLQPGPGQGLGMGPQGPQMPTMPGMTGMSGLPPLQAPPIMTPTAGPPRGFDSGALGPMGAQPPPLPPVSGSEMPSLRGQEQDFLRTLPGSSHVGGLTRPGSGTQPMNNYPDPNNMNNMNNMNNVNNMNNIMSNPSSLGNPGSFMQNPPPMTSGPGGGNVPPPMSGKMEMPQSEPMSAVDAAIAAAKQSGNVGGLVTPSSDPHFTPL